MKWTSLNNLRTMFTSFFEEKGHLRLDSFSLIPKNDNSLLLINSGMAPMKKYFTGEVTPPRRRITTCQKCIRTPDIERVGITDRHGTFFEMLGNFSFGDYFKHEVTGWAWEFCTKILELPEEKLWVTIYKDDNEAYEIWTKEVGVNPSHVVKLGKEDNFWEHGSGPCGPCSELYFDRGEEYGCGSETCGVGCDCDRFIEFWNLVFTQFDNDGHNNYSRLDHPNIDTGMGLERIACIMQGVDNLFLVDTIQNIMSHVSKIANISYGKDKKSDISLRVITDHIRSVTFMAADGIMPSNEGRGYVFRRLLRRAARHGRLLGINKPFLFEICETVAKENAVAYPEILHKIDFIKKLVKIEEENFSETIEQGLKLLEDAVKNTSGTILSGEVAFKLNDTYGFPLDLTKEILAENGMTVDEDKFNLLLIEQKNRARNARSNVNNNAWSDNNLNFSDIDYTVFVGYDNLTCESKIVRIIKDNKFVNNAILNDKIFIILDKTPFYAQSGGQVGDVGYLYGKDNLKIKITNTTKNQSGIYLHEAIIESGIANINIFVESSVDKYRRFAIMRNHTAAHLLHSALRKVLGTHVEQAGQLVSSDKLRFDFTHFSALTDKEISQIESIINKEILNSVEVVTSEMPLDEAKKIGAMALFDEKYGNMVRVVKAGDFSIELCGGTHVKNTAEIGILKVISESSVAAGVRRIVAITSVEVPNLMQKYTNILYNCQKELKANDFDDILVSCKNVVSDLKNKNKLINKLNTELANINALNLINSSKKISNTNIVIKKFYNNNIEFLKLLCDSIKNQSSDFVAVFANIEDNKTSLIVSIGDEAIEKGLHAGNIVKKLAYMAGGNGGGKKDFAMAGIKNVEKLDEILNFVCILVKNSLNIC